MPDFIQTGELQPGRSQIWFFLVQTVPLFLCPDGHCHRCNCVSTLLCCESIQMWWLLVDSLLFDGNDGSGVNPQSFWGQAF